MKIVHIVTRQEVDGFLAINNTKTNETHEKTEEI